MLVDIGLWALDSPAPNIGPATLMVVAKNIEEETQFVHLVQNLKASCYNTIFVVPDGYRPEELPMPNVNLAWYWKSLQSTRGRRAYPLLGFTSHIISNETR